MTYIATDFTHALIAQQSSCHRLKAIPHMVLFCHGCKRCRELYIQSSLEVLQVSVAQASGIDVKMNIVAVIHSEQLHM